MLRFISACLLGLALLPSAAAQEISAPQYGDAKAAEAGASPLEEIRGAPVPCEDGMADAYACLNVELLSFLPVDAIGGTALNDIWGWTDPETRREYALVGRRNGVAFVDVTDPIDPVFLGSLPATPGTPSTTWRDVKVYGHHAFVVADNAGDHGVQVFDLRRLRDVVQPPSTFSEAARYDGIGSAHNIVVNEASGFAYAVASTGGACGPGLHMIDVNDPLHPVFAGCFSATGTGRHGSGYTHDAQCVLYDGPDDDYAGREVCLAANETALNIVDVTHKDHPRDVARAAYPGVHYAHQGWLTEDHRYFLMDDELDEVNADTATATTRTRTIVWDVMDLDDPQVVSLHEGTTTSIDHNQYVAGDRVYQANYTSGLRVLDVSDPTDPKEIAFFDTYPADDSIRFAGAWSVYPYFESGSVIVSSINEGLFVLRPAASPDPPFDPPAAFRLLPAFPNPFDLQANITLEIDRPQHVRVDLYDLHGRHVAVLFSAYVPEPGRRTIVLDARRLASGAYIVRARGEGAARTTTITVQK